MKGCRNMEYLGKKIYEDTATAGAEYRRRYADSVMRYVRRAFEEAEKERDKDFSPEKFSLSREDFRAKYRKMLGIAYQENAPLPTVKRECVGIDEFCKIERLSVETMDDFYFYGMLLTPLSAKERTPLCICQHGGGGSPEFAGGMLGANNYAYFMQRALLSGCTVFAPQIMVWGYGGNTGENKPDFAVPYDRLNRDADLRQVGKSITGIEIFSIMRCLDYLLSLPEIDETRVGMLGLSYGGYYSLYTAAADPRIKVAYSAAAFNGRSRVCFADWAYCNAANSFHDAEVAGLCAPRKLFVDVGKADFVFDYRPSVAEAERAQRFFDAAGVPDRFSYHLWEGEHRFDAEAGRFREFFNALVNG